MTDILKEFYEIEESCSCDGNCNPCKKAREVLHDKVKESIEKIENKEDQA